MEYNRIVILGAFTERSNNNNDDDNLQISCPVITNDGMIAGHQLKSHPFGSQRKELINRIDLW